jgi:5-formyltetrahydrofolate cyclo-ligase
MCQANTLDLILIPLLIFDLNGHRVGYGKGFYDRFLANCNPGALKVGLCMEAPVAHIDDVNAYDIKLDLAVNPDQVFWFN